MIKKDDIMKFITLFNKLQYEKQIDDDISTNSFADYLIDDINLKKMAPERFNYYKDLIAIFNKRPQLLYNILKKYYRFQDIKEKEKKYLNKLSYYREGDNELNTREFQELLGKGNEQSKVGDIANKLFKRIKEEVDKNIMQTKAKGGSGEKKVGGIREGEEEGEEKKGGGEEEEGGGAGTLEEEEGEGKEGKEKKGKGENYKESKFRNVLKRDYGITNLDNLRQPIYVPPDAIGDEKGRNEDMEKRYKTQNKLVDIDERINMFYDGDLDKTIIKSDIKRFENDPDNPLKELEITFDDRLVFIFSTFFIRYITLVLVKWSIDINIIKTFEEGFYYYAAIYLTIFWFIVLFVNIDNSTQVDYMNFDDFMNSIRSVFYYYYMGTNGITRLFIHSALIVILLMIPVILNIRKKNDFDEDEENTSNILNYEERKKLIKSLSLFTIYIWILTSIIATKF